MVVISIINVKGGVGKTMTSINLAGQIAAESKSVLLIDNDSQGNLSQILNAKNTYTMYDLYSNNKINFDDCITKYNDKIDVIPNSIESAILETELHNKLTRETILKNKFQNFKKAYDFIIIDNSPFLGLMTINAMAFSDYYIEVIDNSPSALQGLNMVDKLVVDLRESLINKNINLLGILRNKFENRSIFTKQFKEVTEDAFGGKCFKTIIPDTIKYKEATACNMTIQEYDKKYVEPYKLLYKEIIERL